MKNDHFPHRNPLSQRELDRRSDRQWAIGMLLLAIVLLAVGLTADEPVFGFFGMIFIVVAALFEALSRQP